MPESIRIFYSYSHEDERLRKKLETHLALLQREGLITAWHDRDIGAGAEWEREINTHLNTAQIILLLISASFFSFTILLQYRDETGNGKAWGRRGSCDSHHSSSSFLEGSAI